MIGAHRQIETTADIASIRRVDHFAGTASLAHRMSVRLRGAAACA